MDNYQDSRCLALEKALTDENVDPTSLPFLFLKAITQDFSDNQRIASGGFGSVYKGALRNGMVAVKKLHNKIEVPEEDFLREVACLIEVKHRNIVRFLGYCYETQHTMELYQGRYVVADEWHMLFCFEFLSKGSLTKYVTDASSGLEWRVRYQIIKGICEGVCYLHQQPIVHMDLKPDNILLDDTMLPKITDFGISRRFRENQSKIITENKVGSLGYMAPEFLRSGIITLRTDIYSLGVIIIEILTGSKECPNVNKVLESWTNTFGTSKSTTPLEQVKLCAEIGIDCMHDDPSKRPDIQDIIGRLNETTDISVQLGRFYQYYRQAKQACKPMRITASVAPELRPCCLISETALLDVHPLELCFPFEAKKVTQCSLNLINRTDRYFAYFIRPQFQDMSAISQPMIAYDLHPMSTVVLTVKMVEQELPPLDAGMFEILMISMESKTDLQNLESSIGKDCYEIDDELLKRVQELDGEVHAAMLTTAVCPPRDAAHKVVSRFEFQHLVAMDMHPTQPWILTGHNRQISIFMDYDKQVSFLSIDIENKTGKLDRFINGHALVRSVKFIPQKEWFVAGDHKGYIHVYTCPPTMKTIVSFKAADASSVVSLAIHPTYPYLLSATHNGVNGDIKLWDWDKGWACSRHVHLAENYCWAPSVKFNPNDPDTFSAGASPAEQGGLKVWSISPSAQPITTMKHISVTDYDHVSTDEASRDHVVIAEDCKNIKIWDLQTGTHVHSLYATGSFFHHAVACHPTLPLIAVASKDNPYAPVVQFWNSTNYRLEKTVRCRYDSQIKHLGFVGSRRFVIGTDMGIEVLEIDMESLACQQ